MERIIAPCPSCGALGEAGTKCLFCGMSIPKKDSSPKQPLIRFADESSVRAEVFAKRIAKYHSVGNYESPGVSKVRIGSLYGLINRNGDIVVPIRYSDIEVSNGRWLFLHDDNEVRLIDMQSWRSLNWKESSGAEEYEVKEGLKDQLIISRGTYRDRNTLNYDWQAMANSYGDRNKVYESTECVFQPKYSIYDFTSDKVINEGEGIVFPFPYENIAAYQVNYRYQANDTLKYDSYWGGSPVDGKITSITRYISRNGEIIAEISGLDIDEEIIIKNDAKGYFVIPKEKRNDPCHLPPLYHQLELLTITEKKLGLHRFLFNSNLNDTEQVVEFAKFIKNEAKALRDLNEKRRRDIIEAEQKAKIEKEKQEKRKDLLIYLFIILAVGGFLLFCALI